MKDDFKEKFFDKYISAKRFLLYMIILLILFVMMMSSVIYLQVKELIPFALCVIIEILVVLLVGIPIIIINWQNSIEIKNLCEKYKKSKKISKYTDRTGSMKIVFIIEVVLIVVFGILIADHLYDKNRNEPIWENLPLFDSLVDMEYEDIGNFSVKIPVDFELMSKEKISKLYPAGDGPTVVYMNDDGAVNIGFKLTDIKIKNNEVEKYTEMFKGFYEDSNDGADIAVGFTENNGHNIGNIEFISSSNNIYNHIVIFSVDDKLVVGTFNCRENDLDEWKNIGNFIINSIKFE